MMDHDSDEVDVDIPSLGGLSASSSSSEPLALDLLAGLNLEALNNNMKRMSDMCLWRNRIEKAGDDDPLFSDVLMYLTTELQATDLKSSFIAIPSYLDADVIVTGFNKDELEQWKAGIRGGVETNDWVGLVTHPKLRNPKVENVAMGVPIECKDAVIRAWSLEYHGDAHKVLLKAIDDLHVLPIESNYAKIMPIVQSSGTGKSKTVDKVAMERILFPVCLREDIGKQYFAYPPTDKVVRDYFDVAPGTTNEAECKRYLRLFLSSLFASAHRQAEHLFVSCNKVSYTHMAEVFYDLFADPLRRNAFYEDVVANARKGLYEDVWAPLNKLKNILKRRCSEWPSFCPLLLSIDEVHVLYTHRRVDIGSDYTLYSRLKSVLNEGVSHGFTVISLSTARHIPSLAPSKETAPSMRERDDERILPVPFTELPFDVYVTVEPLVPGQATLTSVGSLEFTAKFGRPLFYASYLSRKGRQESNIVHGIMRNVREKLSGRPWPPEAPADIDASSIAILSARLLLDLSPATVSARGYEEELVRNNLRMLYSVHEDRGTIVTGSSPEPLLAEASAQIMHHTLVSKKPYMNLWDLLGKFVDRGLASQGAIGELIGRALSISAMDRAINGLPKVCELKYQTPVTVADYYKAFLTDEAWGALRQSTPANRARLSDDAANKTFEDAFQAAYFHFSHYGKANDTSPMRDTCAWANWLRGTAVACQLNQELTDRMTPIYFSRLGNVSPKTISVNLDQDKTGQSVNPVNVAIQSAEDLSIFSHGNKLPYIAAVHCYALTEDQGITVTEPSSYNLRNPMYDKEAPRYQINFRGLSAYRNITDAVGMTIRAMINRSKNAVFDNHPREYGVPSLRRMLPVLTEDPASTEWFGGFDRTNAWNAGAA